MIPVKSSGAWRRLGIMLRRWEIWLRMRELHHDPDMWFTESKVPEYGSPWDRSRSHPCAELPVGTARVIDVAEAEARLRLEAVHDYVGVLGTAAQTRRAYSLYVMCRSIIEACAFSTWVFNPGVGPTERLLRGLALREQSLGSHLRSLRSMQDDDSHQRNPDERQDIERARSEVATQMADIERIAGTVCDELGSTSAEMPKRPSRTQRVREMLCDDMDLPQGFDAYHRMSGVAHSDAIGIIGTWSPDSGKPSIDYYSFLSPFHLALCSIQFALEQRGACWGETHTGTKLHKIIARVERIIEGEPGVELI